MNLCANYYKILEIENGASISEVKHAYRRLALLYHPDHNVKDAKESYAFLYITNAYKVLSNELVKKEYDDYLKKSKGNQNRYTDSNRIKQIEDGNDYSFDMNSILWDIEEVIGKSEEKLINLLTIRILAFIEKWVLIPNGLPDYFSTARKLPQRDPYIVGKELLERTNKYLEYASISDYYFDIRKRMNIFLEKKYSNSLFEEIDSLGIRKIDAIIETQNVSQYLLGKIFSYFSNNKIDLNEKYKYSNKIYEGIETFI